MPDYDYIASPHLADPVRLMEDKKVIERMLWALEMVWTPTLESRFDIAHCYGLAFRPETEALYRLALRKLLQFKDLGVRDHSTTAYVHTLTSNGLVGFTQKLCCII